MKNMKNILTIAVSILIAKGVYGQAPNENKETKEIKIIKKTTESSGASTNRQENEIRNFRFGLVILPSINWYETESKIFESDKISPKFGGGLSVEFRLAKVAAFQAGINIVTGGGKLKYSNGGLYVPGQSTVSYYNSTSEEILELDEVGTSSNPTPDLVHYQLNKRSYKTTYISIPFLLKLKTREIGTMVYYGQFGLNSFFRWKGRADDNVSILYSQKKGPGSIGEELTLSNQMISRDVSFYNAALNFGLGAEWNLAGTTSFLMGVSYNLGFTNVLRKRSKYLERRLNKQEYNQYDPATSNSYITNNLEQIVKENSLVFTIGVLF